MFNQQMLQEGETIVDPGVPVKEGEGTISYSFSGWSPEFVSGTACTENITFEAQWRTVDMNSPAYAMLYDDGSMVFQRGNEPETGKTLVNSWTKIETESYSYEKIPWKANQADVISVSFKDKIMPVSTACWFYDMKNCTSMDLAKLDTSSVTDMSYMFKNCSGLTSLDISSFNTSKVTDMGVMFRNCSKLTVLDVSQLDTANVTNMQSMFGDCSKLTTLDLSGFNTSNVTSMASMFGGLYESCSNLISLDLSSFNTSNVTDMNDMFHGCKKLTSIDLSSFDTAKVWNMSYMFRDCSNLVSLDLSSFNTSKVTDMSGMFWSCSSLASPDLLSFDTSNVTKMTWMFRSCYDLVSLDLSSFCTPKVTNLVYMFDLCGKLTTLDISSFKIKALDINARSKMFVGVLRLQEVKLGVDHGVQLNVPFNSYVPGADGNWYNSAGTKYNGYLLPLDVPDTYYAAKKLVP